MGLIRTQSCNLKAEIYLVEDSVECPSKIIASLIAFVWQMGGLLKIRSISGSPQDAEFSEIISMVEIFGTTPLTTH